jgi:N-acetylneuraminic acid mutarotase
LPNYPHTLAETQAELIGTDIIISGGFINSFANTTNHTYARSIRNYNNDTWRRMDDMPAPIGITHAATVVIGSKMYMCGGYVGPPRGPHVSNCFIYDHSIPPGSGLQWSAFVPLPNNGTGGGAMLYDARSNTIYYSGGAQRPIPGNRFAVDQVNSWKISLVNTAAGWRNTTPIQYQGNHQSYVTVNYLQHEERHYVLGGQRGENEATGNVNDMFEFHSNTETWSRKANMIFPRGHATVSTRSLGVCGFIIAGGAINGDSGLSRTNEIHYYHIPNNTWFMMGTLPQTVATPPVVIQDDYMYYFSNVRTRRRKIVF